MVAEGVGVWLPGRILYRTVGVDGFSGFRQLVYISSKYRCPWRRRRWRQRYRRIPSSAATMISWNRISALAWRGWGWGLSCVFFVYTEEVPICIDNWRKKSPWGWMLGWSKSFWQRAGAWVRSLCVTFRLFFFYWPHIYGILGWSLFLGQIIFWFFSPKNWTLILVALSL